MTPTYPGDYRRRMRVSRRGGNPLVRRTDRIEAWLFSGLVAAIVVAVPLAALVTSGSWGSWVAVAEQQYAQRITVSATRDAAPDPATAGWGETGYLAAPSPAPATWQWGDEQRRDIVPVDPASTAGTEVTVWVDAGSGRLVEPPLSVTGAKVTAVAWGLFVWTFAVLLATTLFQSARWGLEHSRRREWSREIEAFLGSTSSY